MLIARLVNHRNPHIAMLTLALLDTLVQSCGYPFHLQIATKEFLNELVRRFPERPPPFPGPVMSRILELIHTWKEGICTDSRWKDDLGNIRDMHRLLTFKGYRFRDMPRGNRNETAVATSVRVYLSSVYSITLAEDTVCIRRHDSLAGGPLVLSRLVYSARSLSCSPRARSATSVVSSGRLSAARL